MKADDGFPVFLLGDVQDRSLLVFYGSQAGTLRLHSRSLTLIHSCKSGYMQCKRV